MSARPSPVKTALVAYIAAAREPYTCRTAAAAIRTESGPFVNELYVTQLLVRWCHAGHLKRHQVGTKGIPASYHPNPKLTLDQVNRPPVIEPLDLGTPSELELKWRAFRATLNRPTGTLDPHGT